MHSDYTILLFLTFVLYTHQQCAQTTQNDLLQSGTPLLIQEAPSSSMATLDPQSANTYIPSPSPTPSPQAPCSSQSVLLFLCSGLKLPDFVQFRSEFLDCGQRGEEQRFRSSCTADGRREQLDERASLLSCEFAQ